MSAYRLYTARWALADLQPTQRKPTVAPDLAVFPLDRDSVGQFRCGRTRPDVVDPIIRRRCRGRTVGEASVSLRTSGSGWIPETTRRIAEAALPQGSPAIRVRDAFGELFRDEDFAGLFPQRGRPALSPAVLALVSILQFAEGLSDRQAALVARARIDWKYALVRHEAAPLRAGVKGRPVAAGR